MSTPKKWRCFHCDEVFTRREDAKVHFGLECFSILPACVEKITHTDEQLRELRHRAKEYEVEALSRALAAEDESEGYLLELYDWRRIAPSPGAVKNILDVLKGQLAAAHEFIYKIEELDTAFVVDEARDQLKLYPDAYKEPKK